MKIIKQIFGVLILGVLSSCVSDPVQREITLLVTSNVRGQLDPCG